MQKKILKCWWPMTAKEALEIFAQEALDLIVLDLMLPEIDSFEVLPPHPQNQ